MCYFLLIFSLTRQFGYEGKVLQTNKRFWVGWLWFQETEKTTKKKNLETSPFQSVLEDLKVLGELLICLLKDYSTRSRLNGAHQSVRGHCVIHSAFHSNGIGRFLRHCKELCF